jgi:hypothetical protein
VVLRHGTKEDFSQGFSALCGFALSATGAGPMGSALGRRLKRASQETGPMASAIA